MCMDCGCGEVDERHGNEANIVADDVRRAAGVNRQDVSTTVRNLEASLRRMADGRMAMSGAGSATDTGAARRDMTGGQDAR